MVICYDTLDKLIYAGHGFWHSEGKKHYYIINKSCLYCKEPYLMSRSTPGVYCSKSCKSKDINYMSGKFGKDHPMGGTKRPGKKAAGYKHGLSRTKEYRNFNCRKRQMIERNALSSDANLQKIQLYYTICAYLNKPCEIPMWHVDHIKPISKGGLHHEDNLQILTAAINLQKSNKYPLTDEEQVLYKGITI